MKTAIAAAAAACLLLSLLSASLSDAPAADAPLHHGESQIEQLMDSVLFFEALVMPIPSSQTQPANEVRS